MGRVACVSVAGVHPSRTRTSRISTVCVMGCMCIHTGPQPVVFSEGVESCWPCSCTGIKSLTCQLGWSPLPLAG